MVVLKKLKASSLNEVIVATIIIVTVFGIAMGILSNVLQNVVAKDTQPIQVKINELVYQYKHQQLKLPYITNDEQWSIDVREVKNQAASFIEFEVTFKTRNKTLKRKILQNEES
ncbi:hypothetical protein [Tenacibaculum sp. 190524A02b]|uniref:Type II secretion system protein n=1 Tax=Tenacibaculum vairaonense TaxID=3137860 RepID=A0ABM9PQF3_9FLAO